MISEFIDVFAKFPLTNALITALAIGTCRGVGLFYYSGWGCHLWVILNMRFYLKYFPYLG